MSKTHTHTKYSKACRKVFRATTKKMKLRNSLARFSDLPKETWSFAKGCYVYHGNWDV